MAELRTAQGLLADLQKAALLTPDDYEAKMDRLSDDFRRKLQNYAQRVSDGDITEAEFRRMMERTIRSDYASAFRFGASSEVGRTILDDGDLMKIRDWVGKELVFLDGFASDLHQAKLDGDGKSEAYIKNRTDLYANGVRKVYWSGKTDRQPDNTLIYWQAEDDAGTCDPCAQAEWESPYTADDLPGMPGEICDGGGRCRCSLRYEQPADAAGDDSAEAA